MTSQGWLGLTLRFNLTNLGGGHNASTFHKTLELNMFIKSLLLAAAIAVSSISFAQKPLHLVETDGEVLTSPFATENSVKCTNTPKIQAKLISSSSPPFIITPGNFSTGQGSLYIGSKNFYTSSSQIGSKETDTLNKHLLNVTYEFVNKSTLPSCKTVYLKTSYYGGVESVNGGVSPFPYLIHFSTCSSKFLGKNNMCSATPTTGHSLGRMPPSATYTVSHSLGYNFYTNEAINRVFLSSYMHLKFNNFSDPNYNWFVTGFTDNHYIK
jgi:hypothetical protein